jgi:hypothetical protein
MTANLQLLDRRGRENEKTRLRDNCVLILTQKRQETKLSRRFSTLRVTYASYKIIRDSFRNSFMNGNRPSLFFTLTVGKKRSHAADYCIIWHVQIIITSAIDVRRDNSSTWILLLTLCKRARYSRVDNLIGAEAATETSAFNK